MDIPGKRPGREDREIPPDARCQEAAAISSEQYIPCYAPAVAIVDNGDSEPYFMCLGCADHNCRNRGATLLFTTNAALEARYSAVVGRRGRKK